jgi:hypothetical protein
MDEKDLWNMRQTVNSSSVQLIIALFPVLINTAVFHITMRTMI